MDLKTLLKRFKENEDRIERVLGAIVIVLIILAGIKYVRTSSNSVVPQTSKEAQSTEASTSATHIVAKGETLWSISMKYYKSGYSWNKIAAENKLTDASKIEVGQKLTIPAIVVTQTPSKTNVSTNPETTSVAIVDSSSYTVVKGDNLWKIAVRAYGDGYKWSQIAKANNLSHPGTIHPGNILSLPR